MSQPFARSSSSVGNPSPPVLLPSLVQLRTPLSAPLKSRINRFLFENLTNRFRGNQRWSFFFMHTSFTLYRSRVISISELPGQSVCATRGRGSTNWVVSNRGTRTKILRSRLGNQDRHCSVCVRGVRTSIWRWTLLVRFLGRRGGFRPVIARKSASISCRVRATENPRLFWPPASALPSFLDCRASSAL